MKKSISFTLLCFLIFSTEIMQTLSVTNYGEALQKSLFFYEVQQAGVLPDWNEVSWRGDSMENDFIPGGWFDAGDHFKFTLTIAYTATVLAWGLYEYGDAVEKAGLGEKYKNNLKWALDYIALAEVAIFIMLFGRFNISTRLVEFALLIKNDLLSDLAHIIIMLLFILKIKI